MTIGREQRAAEALEQKHRDDARGVHETLERYLPAPAPPAPRLPPAEQLSLFGIDICTGDTPLNATGQPSEAARMRCGAEGGGSAAVPFMTRREREVAAIVSAAKLSADERQLVHQLRHAILLDDRSWLELLVDACQAEAKEPADIPKVLKAALARGRPKGSGKLARFRCFYVLHEQADPPASFPHIARVWNLADHTRAKYGVDAHKERLEGESGEHPVAGGVQEPTPAPTSVTRSSSAPPPAPTRWVDRSSVEPPPPDDGELPAAPHARSA